jgi:hypothetical protein
MHVASNPHDPRFQNSRGLFPIFMLHNIQTTGPLVPPTSAMVYFPHMAAKNPNKKRKATLDSVLSTVNRGFADLEGKMDRGFAAVAEDIVAIKDDIADVKSTLADHTKILNDHTCDLSVITTNLDKRLQLAVRVSAIEEHLGLDKKIAA